MKPWLEKTYILTFSKEESMFIEDEKLAGPVGGRAPSVWGSSFSAGPQYKNVKTKIFLQDQEFFGKQFLIKEEMKPLDWKMGTETKQIGQYTCFKATASRPSTEVNWTRTNRSRDSDNDDKTKKADSTKTGDIAKVEEKAEEEIEMLEIVAWYTPMIPVSQGPSEYWGLPGLILEVSAGNTTMLCSKIIMNPEEKTKIEAPEKGQVVTKKEYNEIITGKMQEMRDNRGRGDGRSGR
jgi:GLPGLI family protein